ncbi:MAG: PEP-CTERM sorting domain-containing protein [Luteolibacter sp.]
MKANYRAAASAGLLLSACANVGHAATTVQTTVGPHAVGTNFDLLFSTPLTSVTQLVSINDGSVNTGEGATLSISAILTNDQEVVIFSQVPSFPFFRDLSISSFTGNVFSAFATPQDVKALRFQSTGSGGTQPGSFAFPAAAILTFAVVPEPAAAILMALGFVLLAFRHRRMTA